MGAGARSGLVVFPAARCLRTDHFGPGTTGATRAASSPDRPDRSEGLTRPVNFESSNRCARKRQTRISEHRFRRCAARGSAVPHVGGENEGPGEVGKGAPRARRRRSGSVVSDRHRPVSVADQGRRGSAGPGHRSRSGGGCPAGGLAQGPEPGQEAGAAADHPAGRGRPADLRAVQPAVGGLHREEVPGVGPAPARPHPRGQSGPDARRREVRLAQGLQVLHLRHLVDPPGHHPGHRQHRAAPSACRSTPATPWPGCRRPRPAWSSSTGARPRWPSWAPKSRCPRTSWSRPCGSGPSRSRCRSHCVRTATPSSATWSRTARPSHRSKWRRSRCCPRRSGGCCRRLTSGSARSFDSASVSIAGEPRTLEEVGEHFNLTRERIRQIEARAMSKLRHPSSDTGARDLLTV